MASDQDTVALKALALELTRANHPALRRLGADERHHLADIMAVAVRSGYPLPDFSPQAAMPSSVNTVLLN